MSHDIFCVFIIWFCSTFEIIQVIGVTLENESNETLPKECKNLLCIKSKSKVKREYLALLKDMGPPLQVMCEDQT